LRQIKILSNKARTNIFFISTILSFGLNGCSNSHSNSLKYSNSELTILSLISAEETALAINTSLFSEYDYNSMRKKYMSIQHEVDRRIDGKNIDLNLSRKDKDEAYRVLKTIESVLVSEGFSLFIYTDLLSETLTSIPRKNFRFETEERRNFYNDNPEREYFHFDCDTSSSIFYSIGEYLELPMSVINVPGHSFIRWTFDDGTYFYWDTNEAKEYNDRYYQNTYSFNAVIAEKSFYLKPLSKVQLKGYHLSTIGDEFSNRNLPEFAEEYHLNALNLYPQAVRIKNNLSWLYLVEEIFDDSKFKQTALKLSLEADNANPNYVTYKDTLACAYAANGQFQNALEAEMQANRVPNKIEGFRNGKTCLDLVNLGLLKK